MPLKTAVEPVKWIPARSGLASAALPIVEPGAVHEVDDAVGQPRLLQQPHVVVGGERCGRRGLPHDRAAHQRGGGGEVSADAREVERADREDEALERPVLHPVPDAGGRVRLLRIDPQDVVDVVAPEVAHLADRVDLGLVRSLRLVEHRRRVQRRAPRPRQELGRAEEDRRSLVPGHARPVVVGGVRGGDRLLDVLRTALRDVREDVSSSGAARPPRRSRPRGRPCRR